MPATCGVSSRFGAVEHGVVGGQRLAVVHVERGAAEAAGAQRGEQRGGLDDRRRARR